MGLDFLTANDFPGRYPRSYYARGMHDVPPRTVLSGEVMADVCIIGGGYTGLSAACHLANAGVKVVVLEAHRVGWGASGRNGGQLGSGQRLDQEALEKAHGIEHAHRLWTMAEEAKGLVLDRVGRRADRCGFKPGIAHAVHKKAYIADCQHSVEKLRADYNYDAISFLNEADIRDLIGSNKYYAGTLDEGAGHLDPLQYALLLAEDAVAAGAQIFEESRVTSLHDGQNPVIYTDRGHVRANALILACNGYLGGLGDGVTASCRRSVMPINNFILATEPLDDDMARSILSKDVAVADSRFVVNYFRMVEDSDHRKKRLLFGGGESYGFRFPRDIAQTARRPMLEVFPHLKKTRIDYAWGGTLAISMKRMPVFQRLTRNIFAASGYSGHGVAIATLGGKAMAEAVLGDMGRFDIFAKLPSPSFPGGVMMRWPLLLFAMSYYALRDRL